MEPLKDPDGTRKVKGLPPPPHRPLASNLIFDNNTINWKLIKDFLKKQGKISKTDFITMIRMATQIFKSQPNLLCLDDPVTIVGDIHGQFYDFLKLLQNEIGGFPDRTKYLFLGDYVDRGAFSIQVLLLILSLKIAMPKTILMLRGNHECRQLTSYFNFKQQCLSKYDQEIYDMIMNMFDCLPLSCLINGRFLCVHGGISNDLKALEDIQYIERFKEIPKTGLFCDIVWADPVDNKDGYCQKLIKPNDVRGCSYFFGHQITKGFFQKNKLISLIRAHQAQAQGFKMYKWNGADKFPAVITIFSAPNYCDFYNNKGAVIKFENNTLNIQQFMESPHPYLLPNFMDLFSWSIPFVSQKITQMIYFLLKPNQKLDEQAQLPFFLLDARGLIQNLLEDQKKETKQNMQLVSLGGNCPDDKILQNGNFMQAKKKSFDAKKAIDKQNERLPNQN